MGSWREGGGWREVWRRRVVGRRGEVGGVGRGVTSPSAEVHEWLQFKVLCKSGRGQLLNPNHVRGISICLRKHDPSACKMIHIILVQMLQLQSQSILICIVNITLIAKSALHVSHFVRWTMAALYYIAVGIEKM